MTAKQTANLLVQQAFKENPENTDKVETAAQAIRNYLRDNERFSDAFALLDTDSKVNVLRIIRNVISISTDTPILGETDTSEQ